MVCQSPAQPALRASGCLFALHGHRKCQVQHKVLQVASQVSIFSMSSTSIAFSLVWQCKSSSCTAAQYVTGCMSLFDWPQVFSNLQGFLLKAQASKHRPSTWDFEMDALAIMGRAGLLFSIGIRCFFGFGILVRQSVPAMSWSQPQNLLLTRLQACTADSACDWHGGRCHLFVCMLATSTLGAVHICNVPQLMQVCLAVLKGQNVAGCNMAVRHKHAGVKIMVTFDKERRDVRAGSKNSVLLCSCCGFWGLSPSSVQQWQ